MNSAGCVWSIVESKLDAKLDAKLYAKHTSPDAKLCSRFEFILFALDNCGEIRHRAFDRRLNPDELLCLDNDSFGVFNSLTLQQLVYNMQLTSSWFAERNSRISRYVR